MFGFFKNNTPSVIINDKIWLSTSAKWRACRNMLAVNPAITFVAWFKETQTELINAIDSSYSDKVILAESLQVSTPAQQLLIFVEHYPLSKIEQNLFLQLNLEEVPVLSSLDEPLFMTFGGERTVKLMKELGMKDEEVIGHSMITKSISRAQAKIAKSVSVEKKVHSQEEWFRQNMK